jgi:haloacetate dehalogenase
MFEKFDIRHVKVVDAQINVRTAGSGPPLLLLHGYPQTGAMWHRIAPTLSEKFTVVIPDLRGYGASSKPAGSSDHSNYSKRTMANDQVSLMEYLGYGEFLVAGHDRGGRCAYRMALDHPEKVKKLAVLDIVPTYEAFSRGGREFGLGYWHWYFLAQADIPEKLISADPVYFWNKQTSSISNNEDVFHRDALDEYINAFCRLDTIHATCEDYRAGATVDVEHDALDRSAGRKIECPLLILWGSKTKLQEWYDVLAIWQDWGRDVGGGQIEAGHFLAEENPEAVIAQLDAFFADPRGP